MAIFEILLAATLILFIFVFIGILIVDFFNLVKRYPPFLVSKKEDFSDIYKFFENGKRYNIADLGAGDGKVLIELAKSTQHILTGYELNPFITLWTKIKLKLLKLHQKVEIRQQNFLTADFSQHDFYYIYGIGGIMPKVEEKLLEEAQPGTLVASNRFQMKFLKHVVSSNNLHLYKI
jgi:hypothetical protein